MFTPIGVITLLLVNKENLPHSFCFLITACFVLGAVGLVLLLLMAKQSWQNHRRRKIILREENPIRKAIALLRADLEAKRDRAAETDQATLKLSCAVWGPQDFSNWQTDAQNIARDAGVVGPPPRRVPPPDSPLDPQTWLAGIDSLLQWLSGVEKEI
jgi:hypothetical protein